MTFPAFDREPPCTAMDPDDFFSPSEVYEHYPRAAFDACASCPFAIGCLEWAVHNERHGLWGGTTGDDRRKIRKRRNLHVRPQTIDHGNRRPYGIGSQPVAASQGEGDNAAVRGNPVVRVHAPSGSRPGVAAAHRGAAATEGRAS